MLSLQLTQLTISLFIAAVTVFICFLPRTLFSLVGVATVTGLAIFAGFRTVDLLSSLRPEVIRTITAQIFPFVRRRVKSYSRSVDVGTGYKLETEVSRLLNCIVRHCVQSWYYHISECHSPVDDAQLLIRDATKLLVGRLSRINRYRFLCKILQLYRQHLSRCDHSKAARHSVPSYSHLRNISASKNVICIDNELTNDVDFSDTVTYLNRITFMITAQLLDECSQQCLLGREILSQIIVKEVLLKVLDVTSKPEWLYNAVVDIVIDSSDDSLAVADYSCAAENNVDYHSCHSSCYSNNVANYCTPCEPQATATNTAVSAKSEHIISNKEASTSAQLDEELLPDVTDAASVPCSDEHTLIAACCNDSEHNDTDLSHIEPADAAASVSDCENSSNVASFLHNQNHRDSSISGCNSDGNNDCCSTFGQNRLKTLETGSGYHEQPNCTAENLPEVFPDNAGNHIPVTFVQDVVNPAQKKRFSVGNILPHFKNQTRKHNSVSSQSAFVHPLQGIERSQTKDTAAENGSSCSVGRNTVFMKMKPLYNSLNDLDDKPHISHSASMDSLVTDSGYEASTSFSLQRLTHLVQKVSSHSVHIPRFRIGSPGLPSAEVDSVSDSEYESVSDVEETAVEAGEDIALDRQPEFLFDSVCISETERDVPVSKPYTVYVISVSSRIIPIVYIYIVLIFCFINQVRVLVIEQI